MDCTINYQYMVYKLTYLLLVHSDLRYIRLGCCLHKDMHTRLGKLCKSLWHRHLNSSLVDKDAHRSFM